METQKAQNLLKNYYSLRRRGLHDTDKVKKTKVDKKDLQQKKNTSEKAPVSSDNKYEKKTKKKKGARREDLLVSMLNTSVYIYTCIKCAAPVEMKSYGPVSCKSCDSHVVLKPRSKKSNMIRAI